MQKRYIFLAILLILVGAGTLLLPEKQLHSEISPENLLIEINDQARYLSTDHVAERLIEQDPTIMLIDVRLPDDHEYFAIPGSLNIPLEEVAHEMWEDYLNMEDMDVVFYSNSDIYSDQAWILCKRKGYKNIYVMKGGLNCWFATILQPSPPVVTEPSEAFDLYSFRLGARMYFAGGSVELAEPQTSTETVTVKRKKKKAVVEGGC